MGKGKLWSDIESRDLAMAVMSNSVDAKTGTDQKGVDFWEKVGNTYNALRIATIAKKEVENDKLLERTLKGMMAQWDKISRECTFFEADYMREENAAASGSNAEIWLKEAQSSYLSKRKQKFKFHLAWRYLRTQEKFVQMRECSTAEDPKNLVERIETSKSDKENTQGQTSTDVTSSSSSAPLKSPYTVPRSKLKRPIGQKKAKSEGKKHSEVEQLRQFNKLQAKKIEIMLEREQRQEMVLTMQLEAMQKKANAAEMKAGLALMNDPDLDPVLRRRFINEKMKTLLNPETLSAQLTNEKRLIINMKKRNRAAGKSFSDEDESSDSSSEFANCSNHEEDSSCVND